MTSLTEGHRLLQRQIDAGRVKQADLVRVYATDSGAVSRWFTLGRVPKLSTLLDMERNLGIPVAAWTRPARRAA